MRGRNIWRGEGEGERDEDDWWLRRVMVIDF